MDASTLTDPDCLGPCEPGTSVTLEGLVWAESNNGMYPRPFVLITTNSHLRRRRDSTVSDSRRQLSRCRELNCVGVVGVSLPLQLMMWTILFKYLKIFRDIL